MVFRFIVSHVLYQLSECNSRYSSPTPLDALVFAYLHSLLRGPPSIRDVVNNRANLTAWELRVRGSVAAVFELADD
jgi:metaxin